MNLRSLVVPLALLAACQNEPAKPAAPAPATTPPPAPAKPVKPPPPFAAVLGPTLPKGLEPTKFHVPADNPLTPAKVTLGHLLYFDARLSADGTVSCATCHDPAKGFADGAPVSTGIKGQKGGRSAPTVINRAFTTVQFWDGRAGSLEEQAKGPLTNPIEMGNPDHAAVVARLAAIKGYAPLFQAAFGTETFTIDHVAQAIASFERTVLSGNSAWDRYERGDKTAMTEAQVRGLALYQGKAKCSLCHVGFNLSDEIFHNLGTGLRGKKKDHGRFDVTKVETDKGKFRTPTLRDITKTAPYMVDGSIATLEAVIDYYDQGCFKNPWLDEKITPLKLTKAEKADLLAFLHALEGEGWQGIKPPEKLPE